MSNPILDAIIKDIEAAAIAAAKEAAAGYIPAATEDAIAFVKTTVPMLERWIGFLISGAINTDEFKSLLLGLKDVIVLNALTQAGLISIEVEKTKNAILNAVTQVATGAIKTLI